ncbi:hypothetical protein [uncultured Paraglaciecola sp.]|uniref:hypothetical protein n=1 Tax=uncultured Paraglaciecola sp. TaxID=1765024 RepID=UPI00260E8D07|nr:hypothetical protein [uncultured Paraglaciecola sp.]
MNSYMDENETICPACMENDQDTGHACPFKQSLNQDNACACCQECTAGCADYIDPECKEA